MSAGKIIASELFFEDSIHICSLLAEVVRDSLDNAMYLNNPTLLIELMNLVKVLQEALDSLCYNVSISN